MALCEKILIAGFSGAGKSSLVRALKNNPPEGWTRFDDLDELILKNRGKKFTKLSELIEKEGWEKFRLWERQELESWLKEEGKGVIALGGGTLSSTLLSVYGKHPKISICCLEVSFATAWKRLVLDKQEPRPMITQGKENLEKIFLERMGLFTQIEKKIDGEKDFVSLRNNFLALYNLGKTL